MAEQTMEMEKQEVQTPEGIERTGTRRIFMPRVDIYETEDSINLLADMPGVTGSSLDITLEKNILTLRGQVDLDRPEGYDLAYAEYGIGDYERTFALSDEVDRDKIEATMKNGVLHLVLPKSEVARARKIAVKSG